MGGDILYFEYGDKEIEYLSRKDKRLGEAISRIGHIDRETETDLFASVIHHIIGQQISTAAQQTVWKRLSEKVGMIDAKSLLNLGRDGIQSVGITFKKADYILDFACHVHEGTIRMGELYGLTDEEVIQALSTIKGIGVWTAEMIMTFCMQRPDIVSFGDLAILRGMRMLYRHRTIDKVKFEKYRKRYTPYGTVASLYLWAIAGGALPELTDPAKKKCRFVKHMLHGG